MEDNKTKSLFTQEITSMPEKENQVRCMGCMEEFSAEFELCPNCGYVIGTAPKLKSYLRPGTWLSNGYVVGKVIGQGGFGITYIGWDRREKRKVAIKEFFPTSLSTREDNETGLIFYNAKAETYFSEGVKKMLDEGKRLSKYSSNPNIVNVYDCFEENGTAYIVMEYLEGESLKDYAAEKGGRLDPREAVNLMMPIISALEEMHKENMIHRDIAPDNIYICNDGRIKLLDFGSARIAVQDAEKSLSVMVKPGYAPKEQYASRSKQGPWTDVYSVCATIYKLVTGESPVESIEREVTPLKTFAEFGIEGEETLENVLAKGLEPDPEKRIQNAETLKNLLLKKVLAENSESQKEDKVKKERVSKTKKTPVNDEAASCVPTKGMKFLEAVNVLSMVFAFATYFSFAFYVSLVRFDWHFNFVSHWDTEVLAVVLAEPLIAIFIIAFVVSSLLITKKQRVSGKKKTLNLVFMSVCTLFLLAMGSTVWLFFV